MSSEFVECAERQASELLACALDPLGIEGGVSCAAARSWNVGSDRVLQLAGRSCRIVHDEREAPFVLDAAEGEDRSLLVSISDEEELAACAWACVGEGCALMGLGVDLASPADFAGKRGERFNHLIFSPQEQWLAPQLATDEAMGYAFAFSAKEAAFKACAAPLRRWYEAHDEEFVFDLREFELVDAHESRGVLRHARAQQFLDRMNMRIRVERCEVCGMALSVALAER